MIDFSRTQMDKSSYGYVLLVHILVLTALEQVGGPVSKIEEDKGGGKSDTGHVIDPRRTLGPTIEPFTGQNG